MGEMKNKKDVSCSIYAPVNGKCIALENVNDPMFSTKKLGEGVAFQGSSNVVCAPCDGKVLMIAATKHTIGFECDNNTEVLLHIGLGTVNLNGAGLRPLVSEGDVVKAGTPVMEIDREYMQYNKVDLTTPVVITNSYAYDVETYPGKDVSMGDLVMTSARI